MNEVDRQILSFMRDVEEPAQRNFSVTVIDGAVDADVRRRHLDLLEGRGLVQSPDPENEVGDNKTYWLTAEGIQAITTSDLDQTLGTTNERLDEMNTELEKLQDSQRDSSAVQTLFILTIITLTYLQARQAALSVLPVQAADGIYLLLMLVGILLGGQSLIGAIRERISV